MKKKQITILSFLFFNCFFTWSQQFVKTTTPCNDELLKKTPGRWIKTREAFHAKLSQQQQKEIVNRLSAFHQLMFTIYPSPVAFDAVPSFFTEDKEFGSQLKFDHSPDVMDGRMEVNGTPIVYYSYTGFFSAYGCGREANEMMRGYPSETGTEMSVHVNFLENLFLTNKASEEIMRVNERPIYTMPVLVGKWKGYDMYSPESGSGVKMVLLHRGGILPYIPVTRKQYLDLSIIYVSKLYDKMIADAEKSAKAWGIKPDPADNAKLEKQKKEVLKHYQEEMAATTSAALLDSPSIINGAIIAITTDDPIFTTQSAGGRMLVTENPAYVKKDLPKYIPQFMVFTWWDCHCGVDPSLNPYKLIDEKFPIEKLQAMIDK